MTSKLTNPVYPVANSVQYDSMNGTNTEKPNKQVSSSQQNKEPSDTVASNAQKVQAFVENSLDPSYQIFFTGMGTVVLQVKSSDTFLAVRQKYMQQIGLENSDDVRFHCDGKPLTDERTLADYNIWAQANVFAIPKLLGGSAGDGFAPSDIMGGVQVLCGMATFIFNKLENKKIMSFSDKAPNWRIVKPGLNLRGRCTYEECPAVKTKDPIIYIPKGMSTFNIAKVISKSECPSCSKKVNADQITNLGFYGCIFTIEGTQMVLSKNETKPSEKEVQISDQEAPDDGLLTYEGGTDNLTQWRWLEITTMNKS